MLTPAFHFKILESFLDVMNAQCAILCDEVLAPLANTSREFDVFPIVSGFFKFKINVQKFKVVMILRLANPPNVFPILRGYIRTIYTL